MYVNYVYDEVYSAQQQTSTRIQCPVADSDPNTVPSSRQRSEYSAQQRSVAVIQCPKAQCHLLGTVHQGSSRVGTVFFAEYSAHPRNKHGYSAHYNEYYTVPIRKFPLEYSAQQHFHLFYL